MARRVRDLTTSTWFHVVNRGADRQDIFSSEADYLLFEQLLEEEVVRRFGVEVHAYALMSNHFHLLLHAADGNLSEAMQRLCGRFGAAYNQRAEREGPVFTGRFRSVAVTSDPQLTQVARYIHRNPLAIVSAAALHTYRWSSLGALLDARRCPAWLSTGTVIERPGDASSYLRYVLRPQPSDTTDRPCPAVTFADIEQAVASIAGDPIGTIRVPTPGRANPLRTLAITLAVEFRSVSVEELADYFAVDAQSIRRTARQGRVALTSSDAFARLRLAALHAMRGRTAA